MLCREERSFIHADRVTMMTFKTTFVDVDG